MDDIWLTDEEQAAWRAYTSLSMHLTAALERQLLRDSSLSMAEYAVLVVLSEAECRVLRAKEIAEFLGWERSRVSHQIRRMEGRGFVERRECAEDGRGTVVRLTDAGLQTLTDAAPGHVAAVRRWFVSALEPGDGELLIRMSQKIRATLEA